MSKITDPIKKSYRSVTGKNPSSIDAPQYEDINKEETQAEQYKNKLKDFFSNFKRHKSPAGNRSMFSRVKPKYVLIVLLVICALLIAGSAYTPQAFKPFEAIASVLVVPAQKGVNAIGLWFSDKIELTKKIEDLSKRNRELEHQVTELKNANSMLTNQSAELLRLQDLLNLQEQYADYETVGASIISMESTKWFSTFTINKGSKDGIRKDMNVLADGGLCGIVTETGYNYSVVRSIIDDDSAVSAQFQDSSELCVVHGKLTLAEDNYLEFSDVPLQVEIKEGQAVVTSRVSSKFLPGLLIGYVAAYSTDANELTKSGFITPVVDFTNLNEVLVITDLKADYIIPDEEAEETEETTAAEETTLEEVVIINEPTAENSQNPENAGNADNAENPENAEAEEPAGEEQP